MKSNKILFSLTLIAFVVAFILGSYFYRISNLTNEKVENHLEAKLVRDHSPSFGPKEAPINLVEFFDPECESCRKMYPLVKNLLNKYSPKVRLVLRYAPFHPNSKKAIRAIEAAKEQGKFWESLETLLKNQPAWGDHHNPKPELIPVYLKQIGLDMKRLERDMKKDEISKLIETDLRDLKQFDVRATPTFFVNGKRVNLFGIDYLEQAIERELLTLGNK